MIDRNKSVFGARELTLSRAQFRDRPAVAFATRTHLRATTHSKLSMRDLLAEEAAAAALLVGETEAGNKVVPFCMQLATQMHAATPKGSLNGQPLSAFPHALSSVVHQLQEDWLLQSEEHNEIATSAGRTPENYPSIHPPDSASLFLPAGHPRIMTGHLFHHRRPERRHPSP